MKKIPNFLKNGENNSILFNNEKGYLAFFIPEKYFDSGYAEIDGEYVKLFGIFNYSVYDESEKSITGLKLFKFPSSFISHPSEVVKQKSIKLVSNSDAEDFRILKYYRDSKVIVSTKVPKLVDNVEMFFRMFNTGALPDNIPYDIKHELFLENVGINGYNYQVPASLIGIVVSETSRDLNDPTKPFRVTGRTDMTQYKNVNIKDIPNVISPFTAITSENWDESISNALVNKKHTDSPLEKLFMGE